MSKMKRMISLLMLAAMLISTAACGGGQNSDSSDSADLNGGSGAVDGDMLDIPDNLKFSGKTVTILSAESVMTAPETLDDADAEPVSEAKYYIDLHVEERFDITVDYVEVYPWQDTSGIARQSVNAGSEDYQMVFGPAQHQVNLVLEGIYTRLDNLPYIDLEKPWWNKEYIDSVSFHEDEQYILFGDITYNTIERSTCVFFNINLLEEKLNMQPSDLYNLVYEGKWTIDRFAELVSGMYEDDGNALRDANDTYGLVAPWNESFNWMAYGSGIEFTTRDENGYPKINMYNERTVDMVDKLCKLFFNNEGTSASGVSAENSFGAGKSLFLVNRFFLTCWEQFRTMEDDYGILPIPKYDESIDGYHSPVESLVWWGGVPVTVSDREMVSAVAEMMAYEGRMYLRPAYYETVLKLKLTRDDESMKMIDLIMDGRDTDYLYINSTGGVGDIFKTVFGAKQNNFASAYAAVETAGEQTLSELIKVYKENH